MTQEDSGPRRIRQAGRARGRGARTALFQARNRVHHRGQGPAGLRQRCRSRRRSADPRAPRRSVSAGHDVRRGSRRRQGANAWYVDPIDGTINFVHGVRYWCVSIAFLVEGTRQIGIIFDPSQDELFWAHEDGGAFCNDAPMRVSSCNALNEAHGVRGVRPAAVAGRASAAHAPAARSRHGGEGHGRGRAHARARRRGTLRRISRAAHAPLGCAGGAAAGRGGGRPRSRLSGAAGLAAGGAIIASAPGIYDALERAMLEA